MAGFFAIQDADTASGMEIDMTMSYDLLEEILKTL